MKIVLATGASGGHLFPAIAVAEELRHRDHEIIFVGTFNKQQHQLMNRGFSFELLATKGVSAKNFLSSSWLMAGAFLRSLRLLKEYKPQVVVGFGGHGSFAVVAAAVVRKVPAMIHEQNVVPGRANRWLSRFVQRIAVSFEKTQVCFDEKKTVVTGCPSHLHRSRKDRNAILEDWGLDQDTFTILAFGGSQGAHRINEIVPEVIKDLGEKKIQVIHITGEAEFDEQKRRYKALGIRAAVFTFLDQMAEAYEASDLVIGRSGALTVTECALFRKPAILIPYPFAKTHQKHNAEMLEDLGLASIIHEDELSPEVLKRIIEEKGNRHSADMELNKENELNQFGDASQRLADAVERLL